MQCNAIAFVLVSGIIAACSGGDDLTCGILADPQNCFSEQATALAGCIPMRLVTAILSSDRLTCTFPDGVYIAFNTPLPSVDPCQAGGFSFTVYASDGSVCGSLYYQEATNETILSVNDQASWRVTYHDADPSDSFILSCPPHTYSASISGIDSCPLASIPPNISYSRSLPFSVNLKTSATSSPLFTCN